MRDEAGFTSFVVARGPALKRLAWLLTADADAAEDLVQEALARVFPRWDRIDPAAREAYIRTALRSIWIDGWRRRGGKQIDLVPDLPEQAVPDRALDATPARLALDKALALLTVRQRTVLVLRFYEDLTEVQTAAAMGCTASTVKSQTRHALERLRKLAPHLADAFDPDAALSAGSPVASAASLVVVGSFEGPDAARPGPEPRDPSVSVTAAPAQRSGGPPGPAVSISGPATGDVAAPIRAAIPRRPPASTRPVVLRLATRPEEGTR